MSLAIKKDNQKFRYKDYCGWNADERWELIFGDAFDMSPAPSREHQEIVVKLVYQLQDYFKNRPCSVYVAPFDVRLPADNEPDDDIDTVVQPDISVICDKKKLDTKGCRGAPDLIIEITSPSTAARDIKDKFSLYEKRGVKEYWIVYTEEKVVMVFKLGKNNKYGRPDSYNNNDTIVPSLFKGLSIDLKTVFEEQSDQL